MAATRKASEIRAARKQIRAVTSVRRSVFYVMRAILSVLAVGVLCILSFSFAARVSNTYILVNEGMSQRAECILKNVPVNDLVSFFSASCIESDEEQRSTSAAPYDGMSISSYEYGIKIRSMHLLPWHINTYVDVIEEIGNIKGSVPADSASGTSIPDWAPRKYRLNLGRTNGRWYIESIRLLELNPKLDAPATPDPDASPLPIVTPSPVPTPVPSPTPDEVFYSPHD